MGNRSSQRCTDIVWIHKCQVCVRFHTQFPLPGSQLGLQKVPAGSVTLTCSQQRKTHKNTDKLLLLIVCRPFWGIPRLEVGREDWGTAAHWVSPPTTTSTTTTTPQGQKQAWAAWSSSWRLCTGFSASFLVTQSWLPVLLCTVVWNHDEAQRSEVRGRVTHVEVLR